MKTLQVDDSIPEFVLPDQDGNSVSRSDLLDGKPLVIFFYPKDDSPICTREMCAIRDAYESFIDAGANVVGVSSDPVARHQTFSEKHRLPFRLLSDANGELRAKFGVPNTLVFLPGRATYVIDKSGIIRHMFVSQLDSDRHVSEALTQLAEIR